MVLRQKIFDDDVPTLPAQVENTLEVFFHQRQSKSITEDEIENNNQLER